MTTMYEAVSPTKGNNDVQTQRLLTRQLPFELFAHIVSFLAPTPYNLASELEARQAWLSLSTTSWTLRSIVLPRLFESLIIEKSGRRGDGNDITSPSTQAFCQAVAAGDASAISLISLVRQCTLVSYSGRTSVEGDSCSVYTQALLRATNIQTITMINPYIYENDDTFRVLSSLPKLTSLTISGQPHSGASFKASPEDALILQAIVPRLRTFGISNVDAGTTHAHGSPGDCTSTNEDWTGEWRHLQRVTLPDQCTAHTFLSQSLQHGTSHMIEELDLHSVSASHIDILSNFLNSAASLRTLKIRCVVSASREDRMLPPLPLLESSLPVLETLLCPPGWYKYLLPKRPVRHLDWHGIFDLSFGGPAKIWHSGLEGENPAAVLECLASTDGDIHTLRVGSYDYKTHFLGLSMKEVPKLNIQTLVIRGFRSPSSIATAGLSCNVGHHPDSISMGKTVRFLSSPLMASVTCLRLEAFFERWWDLQDQFDVISREASSAFPAAQKIQLMDWMEWRRLGEASAPIWNPALHAQDNDLPGLWQMREFQTILNRLQCLGEVDDIEEFMNCLESA